MLSDEEKKERRKVNTFIFTTLCVAFFIILILIFTYICNKKQAELYGIKEIKTENCKSYARNEGPQTSLRIKERTHCYESQARNSNCLK